MNTPLNTAALLLAACLLASQAEAETKDAGEAGTASAPSVIDKTSTAVGHGAKVAVGGIERGANAALSGVERGAKAAANGIERGVQATGRAVNKVAQKIGVANSTEPAGDAPKP